MEAENGRVAEGRQADELRQDRLWFLEAIDRVNQAIQDTDDLQQTTQVLDAVLSIFGCDRAWIVYPCDPDSKASRTVVERARAEFAHAMPARFDVPMDTATANELRVVGASEGPMCVATVSQKAISDSSAERVGVRSQLCLTILPKLGKPYMMGLDQFTHARNWTQPERKLSEAIGQRIATLLTS